MPTDPKTSILGGVPKSVRDGTRFDVATSSLIFVGYAVPGFLFAIFLLVIFAGGGYFEIFPLRRSPTEQALSELVADFVRDEIYYREAQRLSLNVNDSVRLSSLTICQP